MYKFLKFQSPQIPCPARHMEIGCNHKECPVFQWADPEYEYNCINYSDKEVIGYDSLSLLKKIKIECIPNFVDKLMKEKMESFNYNTKPKGEGWEICDKTWYSYKEKVKVDFKRKRINRRGYCGLTSGKDM